MIGPPCDAICASASVVVKDRTAISTEKREGTCPAIAGVFRVIRTGLIRSLRLLNSKVSKSGLVLLSSTPDQERSESANSMGTLLIKRVNSLLRVTDAIESRNEAPALPDNLSALAINSARDP